MNTEAKPEQRGAGRPMHGSEPAETYIHLRVTRRRKGAYVAAARKVGSSLAQFIFNGIDALIGFEDKP